MPPQVGISGGARRHGEKAQRQDCHEHSTGLKQARYNLADVASSRSSDLH
jgi:hypothetical protein